MDERREEANLVKKLKVSAALGFLGAVNSMAIGFYLITTTFAPLLISDLMIQGYLLSIIISAIVIALSYGSLLTLKSQSTGAEMNVAAGLALASIYIYYAYLSDPPLLRWLSPTGILLVLPSIFSGLIGIITFNNN